MDSNKPTTAHLTASRYPTSPKDGLTTSESEQSTLWVLARILIGKLSSSPCRLQKMLNLLVLKIL